MEHMVSLPWLLFQAVKPYPTVLWVKLSRGLLQKKITWTFSPKVWRSMFLELLILQWWLWIQRENCLREEGVDDNIVLTARWIPNSKVFARKTHWEGFIQTAAGEMQLCNQFCRRVHTVFSALSAKLTSIPQRSEIFTAFTDFVQDLFGRKGKSCY